MACDKNEFDALIDVIRVWLETESGPTRMKFSHSKLQVQVTILGYKKIILERKFKASPLPREEPGK